MTTQIYLHQWGTNMSKTTKGKGEFKCLTTDPAVTTRIDFEGVAVSDVYVSSLLHAFLGELNLPFRANRRVR